MRIRIFKKVAIELYLELIILETKNCYIKVKLATVSVTLKFRYFCMNSHTKEQILLRPSSEAKMVLYVQEVVTHFI